MAKTTQNEAILTETTIHLGGKLFKCDCGCSVFKKIKRGIEIIYRCNGCQQVYIGGK